VWTTENVVNGLLGVYLLKSDPDRNRLAIEALGVLPQWADPEPALEPPISIIPGQHAIAVNATGERSVNRQGVHKSSAGKRRPNRRA
jgi:hypothetical protein